VALGERQDVFDAGWSCGGELSRGADEALHLGARREDDEGKRLVVGFVADGVRPAARDVDGHAGRGEVAPHVAAVVFKVDRELAALQAVDLLGVVAVQGGRSAAGGLVAHLEAHGYVERVPDPSDRRAKLVRTTARGRDVFSVVREFLAEVDARLAARLGEAKVRRLRALLQDLNAAL